MRKFSIIVLYILSLSALLLGGIAYKEATRMETQSALSILVHPERFYGKEVLISGIYRYGYEESGLYPLEIRGASLDDGIWVLYNKENEEELKNRNGSIIYIRGTLSKGKGHLGVYCCTLSDIEIVN